MTLETMMAAASNGPSRRARDAGPVAVMEGADYIAALRHEQAIEPVRFRPDRRCPWWDGQAGAPGGARAATADWSGYHPHRLGDSASNRRGRTSMIQAVIGLSRRLTTTARRHG